MINRLINELIKYGLDIHTIVQNEISKVFVKVLACAGVYKRTEDGMAAFMRFVNTL